MAALIKNDRRFNRYGHGGATPDRKVYALWHLATNDVVASVEAAGYFDSFADTVKVGDVLLASLQIGSDPKLKHYIVTDNADGAVTIAPQS